MSTYDWGTFGLHIPEIMMPKAGTDMHKWAVVACDQFTSEPEYWAEVKEIVGDAPSTLKLMLPELYLGKPEEEQMIKDIRTTMNAYMEDGTLTSLPAGCILVKRSAEGRERLGLVIATDLESYDYNKGSQSLTRATEATVVERIPPRLRIREGAPIEMPHILILIDDPEKSIIEPLADVAGEIVYDMDLMMNGGHVCGKFIKEADLDSMKEALSAAYDKAVAKYGDGHVIFQAMGDGNHSLATAKASWEKIKATLSPEEIETHPARYALCEIENVWDDGIVFEPIHRVIFANNGQSGMDLVNEAVELIAAQNGDAYLADSQDGISDEAFCIPYFTDEKRGFIIVPEPKSSKLTVGVLQNALDIMVKERKDCEVDYIHGSKALESLSAKAGNAGFALPAMNKADLFPAVAADGALPRKTFSMGEANEKRYYIESHFIAK